MNPWIEAALVALLALIGAGIGWWFSRLAKPFWLLGYLIPLILIIAYGLGNHIPALAVKAPISWLMSGRNKFAFIGLITTVILITPLSRLPQRRARFLVVALMLVAVWKLSVWPFLAPAFNRDYLAGISTKINFQGVCRQSTDYTCGPAAAVTALRKLGLPAEEGEIAILAHTSSAIGTPPDMLAEALQNLYAKSGLEIEYRVFRDLDELKEAGLTLAVIRYSFMLDHYVTVFEVSEDKVTAGDPLLGLRDYSREEFEEKWRFVGVVLNRVSILDDQPTLPVIME